MDVATLHSQPAQEQRHINNAETPCAHCGLPVGPHPTGTDPLFCCTGCAVVFEALHHAGYSNTFYQLSALTPTNAQRKPVPERQGDLHVLEMDTPAFIEAHTRPAGASSRSVTLFLDGVHCAACVWLVEQLPAEVEGVQNARLDLSRSHLTLQFDPEVVQLSLVATWLAKFGYQTYPVHQRQRSDKTRVERRLLIKTGVAWALAGNVMLFAFAMYAGLDLGISGDASNNALATGARWASFVLALISVVYGGSEFFRNAWAALTIAVQRRHLRGLHMDTPISLGILVGFGYGAWATVTGQGDVWFDSITTLIAALLTARWLQLRSYRLASDATDRLLNFIPTMARIVSRKRPAEEEPGSLVKVASLRNGDVISVPAGEVFPVDGTVQTGTSVVDKSVLTGESRPEPLAPGMWIEAGSVNLQTPLTVTVAASGDGTRVGRLLSWVGSQAGKRAPVVLLADRLGGYFVIGLLLLALITAGIWFILDSSQVVARVVALLVISCPCALGMATPLAMAIASGRAARQGIFIKNSEAVQVLETVDTVVIDKTGTLTAGKMEVVSFAGDTDALAIAASLEQHSNHPIAKAIMHASKSCSLIAPEAVVFVQGAGVSGVVKNKKVHVGRPDWVLEYVKPAAPLTAQMDAFVQAGQTPVAIGIEGHLAAVVAIGDKLRPDAPALLENLKASGRQVILLSGDHPDVVNRMGTYLGIPPAQALGGITPEGKKAFIEQLQEHGHVVAMVGDGVNDAAALQAADAGIAVEGGSTPSQVAADVFLTREGLTPVVETFNGSQRVMGVVRRNLGFSLVYNILGAGAAIVGFVTPFVAALAMPASSLIVVLASVLQRSFISLKENEV